MEIFSRPTFAASPDGVVAARSPRGQLIRIVARGSRDLGGRSGCVFFNLVTFVSKGENTGRRRAATRVTRSISSPPSSPRKNVDCRFGAFEFATYPDKLE